MTFTTMYPGAFIYHCAVPNLDVHISVIDVEGPDRLVLFDPRPDRRR